MFIILYDIYTQVQQKISTKPVDNIWEPYLY